MTLKMPEPVAPSGSHVAALKELIEECRNFDTSIYRDAAHANSAMTAKLQEAADALQALQIKIEHWKTARDSAVFVGEQMQKQIKALQAEVDAIRKLKDSSK